MTTLEWFQQALEYLGGSRDDAPPHLPLALSNSVSWALWWAFLSLVIYVFSGQSSKFIYIDF
jgi:hypothetical protein